MTRLVEWRGQRHSMHGLAQPRNISQRLHQIGGHYRSRWRRSTVRAGCCSAHCPAALRAALATLGARCAVSSTRSARSFMFAPQQPARTVSVRRHSVIRERVCRTRSAERPRHPFGLSAAVCCRTQHGVQGCTLSVPLTTRGGGAASDAPRRYFGACR